MKYILLSLIIGGILAFRRDRKRRQHYTHLYGRFVL